MTPYESSVSYFYAAVTSGRTIPKTRYKGMFRADRGGLMRLRISAWPHSSHTNGDFESLKSSEILFRIAFIVMFTESHMH